MMTNLDVINFLNQVRKILLGDKSWLESTTLYYFAFQPINEAFDMAISALEKQDVTDTNVGDMVYRQAAIDAVDSETVSTNPEHFKSSEKFIKFMNDADVASFGKWQWANGFNTAVVAAKIQLKKLPSTHSEIVRCKDCKYMTEHYDTDGNAPYWTWSEWDPETDYDEFCHYAERRTDERTD